MARSQWQTGGMIKYMALLTVLVISCLDFNFESEYEDINGIYLEYVRNYNFEAFKLLFSGDTGYVSRLWRLSAYDFANVDSIVLLADYYVWSDITDFLIDDTHAFLALPYELRVIDISNLQFQVVGTLPIQDPSLLQKSGNLLYIGTTNHLVAVDITDVTNPNEIGSYDFASDITHSEVDSSLAYVLSGSTFYILDVSDPTTPHMINSFAFTDTMPLPCAFTKRGSFVYISAITAGSPVLITYALSTDYVLNETSRIRCPSLIRYFNAEQEHVLALAGGDFYLLNMEYPSLPCIGEVGYWIGHRGLINGNYIYIFGYDLAIFEIRQVE